MTEDQVTVDELRAVVDRTVTDDRVTVDELRAVVEYARAWESPGALPPVLARERGHVDFAAHVHRVPRDVLRELVAEEPDAWEVTHVPDSHGDYFTAQLLGDRPYLDVTFYTERNRAAKATL